MTAAPTRRRLRRGLGYALVLAALALVGFGASRASVDTSVGSFVPAGDTASKQLTSYQQTFGADAVVVVLHGTSQQGLILDPLELLRLIRLEGTLAKLPHVHSVYGPGTVLNQTAGSIKSVLQEIAGSRDQIRNLAETQARRQHLSAAQVKAAGDAALAPFDQRYGKLLAQAMPMGLPSVENQKFVASVLLNQDGNPRPEWRFLVPTAKSATILVRPDAGLDQGQTRRLVAAVRSAVAQSGLSTTRPIVSGVPVLVSGIAQRANEEIPRLGALALAGVGAIFLFVPWSRRRRNRLTPLVAALLGTASTVALFGLVGIQLSLGAVAFLPVLLGVGSDFPVYLVQSQHKRRVIATSVAAAAAFASLALSPLPFVREFGLALAAGLVMTVCWALVLRTLLGPVEPAISRGASIARRASRRMVVLSTAAILALVALLGWALLPGMRVQSSPEQLASGVPELRDVTQAERVLGFSGELDVVLRGKDVLSPAALAWSTNAESTIVRAHADEMDPLLTFSQLLGFLGGTASAEQVDAGAEILPPYLVKAVLSPDHTEASATYGVRLADVQDQKRLIADLRSELPPPPAGYEVQVVGLPVLAADGLTAMGSARYLINGAGILVAALLVGLGIGSWRGGVRVAASALLATGWLFAIIRLFSVELSPLTLAIGALVTVTSCEFVTMLDRRRGAVSWAPRSVATAAAAGTVGYLSLAMSQLAVLRDFGLMLSGGVLCSFAAAWLVELVGNARRPAEVAAAARDIKPPRELERTIA